MKKIFLIFATIVSIATVVLVLVASFSGAGPIRQVSINDSNKGIEILVPRPNNLVKSPLKITGSVSGNGWTGFEGQVGIVKLFDDSGKELALGILTATTDWMQLPTKFETTLWFDYRGEGSGKLVFYNENASGEPERNKVLNMHLRLQDSSSEKITVKNYFNYMGLDPVGCDIVDYVTRDVPKTEAIATAAIEELLKGLTDMEKNRAWFTNINPETKLQSLYIENGVAKADFSDELQKGVAGSCKVQGIRAQITKTLKQFPTVKDVVISINGKSEGILQP